MKLSKHTTTAFMTLSLGLGLSSLGIQSTQAQETAEKKEAPKVAQLNVGDAIPADAFEGVTWVQGDEVKSLDEKGKVYILECWATWCGPCIAVIPHVNELHKKFEDKGLVIIGMNVWEDGIEKPQEFVKKQGDGMSYRVAYSGGRSSGFADKVLVPAGVKGIPRALVVKDGKLLLSIHPGQLNDKIVNSLLDGSFDAEAFAKKQIEEEAARNAVSMKLRALQQAGDWDGMKELAEGLEDGNSMKFSLLVHVATKTSNWTDLTAIRNGIVNGKYSERIKVTMLDTSVARESQITEGAKAYAMLALPDYKEMDVAAKPIAEVERNFTIARLQFMSGQVEETKKTLATAESLLEKIDDPRGKQFYNTIVTGAIKKVNEGSFPVYTELMKK